MIKGIIFDKDGVITDTIPFYYKIVKEFFAQEGIDVSYEKYYTECIQFLKSAHNIFGSNRPYSEYIAHIKKQYFEEYEKEFKLVPQAKEILKFLNGKVKIALGTSNHSDYVVNEYKKAGIGQYFDVTVTADDVTSHKPSPDVYLKCLKLLKLKADECIVVEDSIVGYQAAKTAKIKTIILENIYNKSLYFGDSQRIKSLLELKKVI